MQYKLLQYSLYNIKILEAQCFLRLQNVYLVDKNE